MVKKILILLSLTLFNSCQMENIKVYEKETVIKKDTLNVEKIKIETH